VVTDRPCSLLHIKHKQRIWKTEIAPDVMRNEVDAGRQPEVRITLPCITACICETRLFVCLFCTLCTSCSCLYSYVTVVKGARIFVLIGAACTLHNMTRVNRMMRLVNRVSARISKCVETYLCPLLAQEQEFHFASCQRHVSGFRPTGPDFNTSAVHAGQVTLLQCLGLPCRLSIH
jgi:hypothetical protein